MEMPIKSVTSILGEKRCGAKIGVSSCWVARVEAPQLNIQGEASWQVNGAGQNHRAGEARAAVGGLRLEVVHQGSVALQRHS